MTKNQGKFVVLAVFAMMLCSYLLPLSAFAQGKMSIVRIMEPTKALPESEIIASFRAGAGQDVPLNHLTNLGVMFGKSLWVLVDLAEIPKDMGPYFHLTQSDVESYKISFYSESFEKTYTVADTSQVPGIGFHLLKGQDKASYALVKIEALKNLALRPTISTPAAAVASNFSPYLIKSLLIFFIFLCGIFGVVIYFLLRLKLSLFFGFYAFGMATLLLEYSGIGLLVWGKNTWIDSVIFPFVHYITAMSAYFFLKDFLQTETKAPRAHSVLMSMIALTFSGSLLSLIFPKVMTYSLPVLGICSSTAVLYAVWGVYRDTNNYVRIYLVSWIVFTGFVILYMMSLFGLLGEYFLFGYELAVGTAIDMAMLGGAIYMKIRALLVQSHRDRIESVKIVEQSTRLSALGVMAAGIAHEINNPLAIVMGCARNLEFMRARGIKNPVAEKKALDDILKTIDRIGRIISSLTILTKNRTEVKKEKTTVHELLVAPLEISTPRLKDLAIELKVNATSMRDVVCDKVLISQVLLNLIVNAVDAIGEEKGWINIEVMDRGDYVVLEVSNSGARIQPDVASRIFDPFFTTKDVGKGLGLGLSLAKAIADANSGELCLDMTRPNTTFTLSLCPWNAKAGLKASKSTEMNVSDQI